MDHYSVFTLNTLLGWIIWKEESLFLFDLSHGIKPLWVAVASRAISWLSSVVKTLILHFQKVCSFLPSLPPDQKRQVGEVRCGWRPNSLLQLYANMIPQRHHAHF